MAASAESMTNFNTRPDDTIIALMGMTGVGKSSFISLFTDVEVPIGSGLESCGYTLLAPVLLLMMI